MLLELFFLVLSFPGTTLFSVMLGAFDFHVLPTSHHYLILRGQAITPDRVCGCYRRKTGWVSGKLGWNSQSDARAIQRAWLVW